MQRIKGILSLVFLLLSLVGGLFLVLSKQDTGKKATSESNSTKCQWCGISCIVVSKDMKCPIVAGLAGKQCTTNSSGNCEVKDESVPSKAILPTKVAEVGKNKIGVGLMCGGIEGVLCEEGLVCDYGENKGKADASGMCKEDVNMKNTKVASSIAPLPIVSVASSTTPTVANIAVPTVSGQKTKFDFKIAFEGLNNDAKCVNGWTVDVEVKGDKGLSQKLSQIVLVKERSFAVSPTYRGQIEIDGYTGEKLLVYITGPKQMKMKYGKDLQQSKFVATTGEIVLTVGRVFDFSGYPLLAGDVTGAGKKKDGVVAKDDVTMIRLSAGKREVSDGIKELVTDVNGDCVVNSLDVMMAMKNVGM